MFGFRGRFLVDCFGPCSLEKPTGNIHQKVHNFQGNFLIKIHSDQGGENGVFGKRWSPFSSFSSVSGLLWAQPPVFVGKIVIFRQNHLFSVGDKNALLSIPVQLGGVALRGSGRVLGTEGVASCENPGFLISKPARCKLWSLLSNSVK